MRNNSQVIWLKSRLYSLKLDWLIISYIFINVGIYVTILLLILCQNFLIVIVNIDYNNKFLLFLIVIIRVYTVHSGYGYFIHCHENECKYFKINKEKSILFVVIIYILFVNYPR